MAGRLFPWGPALNILHGCPFQGSLLRDLSFSSVTLASSHNSLIARKPWMRTLGVLSEGVGWSSAPDHRLALLVRGRATAGREPFFIAGRRGRAYYLAQACSKKRSDGITHYPSPAWGRTGDRDLRGPWALSRQNHQRTQGRNGLAPDGARVRLRTYWIRQQSDARP